MEDEYDHHSPGLLLQVEDNEDWVIAVCIFDWSQRIQCMLLPPSPSAWSVQDKNITFFNLDIKCNNSTVLTKQEFFYNYILESWNKTFVCGWSLIVSFDSSESEDVLITTCGGVTLITHLKTNQCQNAQCTGQATVCCQNLLSEFIKLPALYKGVDMFCFTWIIFKRNLKLSC